MEVLGISLFFFAIVAGGAALSVYLLSGALARDRRYLLDVGEVQVTASPSSIEEEEPASSVVDPVGTLAVLLVYLMVLVGLWLAMFAILVGRS
ncbi:MAG: hypothetical protein JO020_27605 [Chloroflexi bacterium]|nr:hypothetical protein [Chloroflexota bacterium]